MALTIRAMKNNLGTSENPYYALASWSGIVESDDFLNRMAQARTTLSKTDILAVFQLAREELVRLLAEGNYVKTPLGAALPVASGSFRTRDDSFLPKKRGSGHTLRIDFRLDPGLEAAALAKIRYVRDRKPERRAPLLTLASSVKTGSSGQVEAGGLIRIVGARLKFDPAQPEQGLYFRGPTRTETRAPVYAYVRPSSLVALVPPDLPEGSYELIVRSVTGGGDLVEGVADGTIQIVAAA